VFKQDPLSVGFGQLSDLAVSLSTRAFLSLHATPLNCYFQVRRET
jgi:hypothetical protein